MTDASILLGDELFNRWTKARLFTWLNMAQREITILKPDAYPILTVHGPLVAGTKQSLPTGHSHFIKAIRNMGLSGTVAGNAVQFIELEDMNKIQYDWHGQTGAATVELYTFDPSNPSNFYVYPPQPSSGFGYLEIISTKSPADISNPSGDYGQTITLDDIFYNPMLEYVMHKAYEWQGPSSPSADAMSQKHYNKFVSLIGRKDLAEYRQMPYELKAKNAPVGAQ